MSKLISVSDEVYMTLSKYKGTNKSFSVVIKEFIENKGRDKGDIMRFAGILKHDKDLEQFKSRIQKDRRATTAREEVS